MGDRNSIVIKNPEDRKLVVQILADNGYTVRIGKEKATGKTTVYAVVQYWREECSAL